MEKINLKKVHQLFKAHHCSDFEDFYKEYGYKEIYAMKDVLNFLGY